MTPRWRSALVAGCVLLGVSGCATGTLATPESSPSAPVKSTSAAPSIAGPTVIVTVPDLLVTGASAVAPAEPAPGSTAAPAPETSEAAPAEAPTADVETPVDEPTVAEPPTANDVPQPAPAQPVEPAPPQPAGEGLNVSLANCDGCSVLATHRGVTGELSAALVGTPTGRAILLSVGGDGQVSGVVGVPYGAAFSSPDGGVLACAQGRCVVEGRQSDGRAILSAFELTGSGAWRDISGDDAFPSATERAAVVDLDGELGIAVQDQADGPAVWMLYTWGGDRYSVVGCAADGAPPAAVDAVSPSLCLS